MIIRAMISSGFDLAAGSISPVEMISLGVLGALVVRDPE